MSGAPRVAQLANAQTPETSAAAQLAQLRGQFRRVCGLIIDRYQSRNGLAVTGDGETLTALDPLEQGGQVRFRLVSSDGRHQTSLQLV